MSEQTNGFDQNGRGTASPTEVDIPILKRKEKERKGAGIILPGAVSGGAQVAGGAGLAKAGGLLALFTGKMGLAALALGAAGAGAIGFGLSQQKGAARPAAPELEALESSINVDRRDAKGSKSLSYMARAGAGQLKWEDPNKAKPAAGADKASDAPADVAEAQGAAEGEGEMPDPTAERPRMANDLSGAKLSSQLGQSGAFGKNSIFKGGTGFNVKTMQSKAKSSLGDAKLTAARRGQLSGSRSKNNLSAKAISTNKIMSGKSLGQLKFAGHRSQAAMNAGDSGGAATYAADAFDQQKTQGGTLEAGAGGIGDGLGTVNPVGSGAPDSTGSGTGPCPSGWAEAEGGGCTPPDMEGINQTRYQGLVDGAKQMADQAKMLYVLAGILAAAAVVAAIVGGLWGWIIAAILAALAVAVFMMARQMGSQAEAMGEMISSMYGQKDQGKIIERAGDNADQGQDSGHNEERAERIWEKLDEDKVDSNMGDETYSEGGGIQP